MKRTKEQNALLDAAILMTISREWRTAHELVVGTRRALADNSDAPRRIDAHDIGIRLRGLKSRGKVEGRFMEEAAMHEWRRTA